MVENAKYIFIFPKNKFSLARVKILWHYVQSSDVGRKHFAGETKYSLGTHLFVSLLFESY